MRKTKAFEAVLAPATDTPSVPRSILPFAFFGIRIEQRADPPSNRPVVRSGEDPTLALERDLELIALLDRLGYDEAWVGEHHSAGREIIADPVAFIAAASRTTAGWDVPPRPAQPAWIRRPSGKEAGS